MEKRKTTEEELNYETYKSQAIHYRNGIKQMVRAFIKKCPKEILLDVLKSEKIISRDWTKKKGIKYTEYEKQ